MFAWLPRLFCASAVQANRVSAPVYPERPLGPDSLNLPRSVGSLVRELFFSGYLTEQMFIVCWCEKAMMLNGCS
ncbi:hypothetical protein BN2476_300047 [Paraburkholderia piptadeniae]|uniref:Uncharacterized protein n=1 Tax=Paraburkholderia piptadeniae TaxID=1701573 RepID=A0A1N7S299_9BURK|nr:hypothetical protein BN2476_300047 [Paraburkholderia piptadeniae]